MAFNPLRWLCGPKPEEETSAASGWALAQELWRLSGKRVCSPAFLSPLLQLHAVASRTHLVGTFVSRFSPGSTALSPGCVGSSTFLGGNTGINQYSESERAVFTSGPTRSLAFSKTLYAFEPPLSSSVEWE